MTIAGGALFGAVGLILAAPLTSAAMRISADLGVRGHGKTRSLPPQGAAAVPDTG